MAMFMRTSNELVDISSLPFEVIEQLGTKEKFWVKTDDAKFWGALNNVNALYKRGREGTGEDWAEVAASIICEELEIPAAKYMLVRYEGDQGVFTPSIRPPDTTMIHGNELLIRVPQGNSVLRQKINLRKHTPFAVMSTLNKFRVKKPISWKSKASIKTGSDVFVGYIMLDTLIGNTDRHYENWALIHTHTGLHLCPTFDHAASLGRNESDDIKLSRITTHDQGFSVGRYASKAKSQLFQAGSKNRLSTLEAFKAIAHHDGASLKAAVAWLDVLDGLNIETLRRRFAELPLNVLSDISLDFAIEIIAHNKDRLLELGL